MKGKFIVLEGIEGSGKTTIKKFIKIFLKKKGIKKILCTREPGGTSICEKLRVLIKQKNKEKIVDETEILLFYAARIQLINNFIKPFLLKGFWIIGDRHNLSSLAYQGKNKLTNFLSKTLLKNFQPDLTIYLDVIPEIGLKRILSRKNKLDRIEKKSIYFFNQVRQRYLENLLNNKKFKKIDATQNIKKVIESTKKILNNFLSINS